MNKIFIAIISPLALSLLTLGGGYFTSAFAGAPLPEWSGFIETVNLRGEEAPAELAPDYWISSTRARLDMNWQPLEHWQLETAIDYQYLWRDPAEIFIQPVESYNLHLDMDKSWQHGDRGTSRLLVDRLNLKLRAGALDATLGRQAIGFGRILISSPLDVIAPFAPDAIVTDVRSGVDAMHAIFNYGVDGQLGVVAIWGKTSRYNTFLASWSDNWAGLDLLMLGGQLRGHNMFGAGVAGSLGTLGLKGEFSIHQGKDVDEPGGDIHDSYALAALEAWYRFDNGLSLITQYLYNGPGEKDPRNYPKVLNSAPLREGLTYLIGQHYLIAAPAYEFHPLATAQGLLIYNIDDHSALIRPTLDLNLADNLSLQLFWTFHMGKEPRVIASFLPAEPRSEFGMRGDSGGLFLKWFY